MDVSLMGSILVKGAIGGVMIRWWYTGEIEWYTGEIEGSNHSINDMVYKYNHININYIQWVQLSLEIGSGIIGHFMMIIVEEK